MSSVFKIYSPEDCDFYYDGELQGHIEGNSKKAFRFEVERKGVYWLEFINSEYQTKLMMKVSIDADEEREVELDFSEVNAAFLISELERTRIITAIEHDYKFLEHIPEAIISKITENEIVTIPKGVRKIGDDAFNGVGYLMTSINIPNTVTSIGNGAFALCSGMTSIIIPNSVTAIGNCAFAFCCSLKSITIPDSVTKIGASAFSNCSSLTSVTIPDSVTEIGESAFSDCSRLTRVTIPDSVIEIGASAFRNCSSLTSVTIPASVTKIGDGAFDGCSSLKSINIPDSVTSIGSYAFEDCSSLISVIIPNSVTVIGDWAFKGCSSLTSVYCKATTPPQIYPMWDPFEDNASNLKIYVPKSDGSTILEAYKSANCWRKHKEDIYKYDFDNE